jgi:rhodanese-related sulfurtransferase
MKTVLTMAPFYLYTPERGKEERMTKMPGSLVLEHPPAPDRSSAEHFRDALSRSTDPSDVHADLDAGAASFVLVDARSPEAFARAHVPGAVSLPHRTIDAATTARFSRQVPIVTYCDGIHCNASTKAAMRLADLGFLVKEMIGGLDGWVRDGFAVETGGAATVETASGRVVCGC